jgi:hypothetical protein
VRYYTDRAARLRENRDVTDADNPLAACRAALGDPDAVYAVDPGRFRAKLMVGGLLVAGGLLLVVALGAFAPKAIGAAAKFILLPLGAGGFLLWHLVRSRGQAVLAYPAGLFRAQRGEVESYPWDEITAVTLRTVAGEIEITRDEAGAVVGALIRVTAPAVRLGAGGFALARPDGRTADFGPMLDGYAELAADVQTRTFPRLYAAAEAELAAGRPVWFGPVCVGPDKLGTVKRELPWAEVGEAAVANKVLTVKRVGYRRAWPLGPLHAIPNPHVAVALIAARAGGKGQDAVAM